MKFSYCVIVLIVLILLLPVGTSATEFYLPKDFCAVSHSLAVDAETAQVLQDRVEKRLGVSCKRLSQGVGDPFSKNFRILLRREFSDGHLVFWLDQDGRSESFHLRGLDLKHDLQFAQTKAKVKLSSASSIVSVLDQLVGGLMDRFPYVGFLDQKGFFVWSEQPRLEVNFVRPIDVERHPLLPSILSYKEQRVKDLEADLRIDEGQWQLFSSKLKGLKPKVRLWMRPSN